MRLMRWQCNGNGLGFMINPPLDPSQEQEQPKLSCENRLSPLEVPAAAVATQPLVAAAAVKLGQGCLVSQS